MNISVVIPLLNEKESLNELSNSILEVMNTYNFSYEVSFIDDGSSDESWEVIEKLSQNSDIIKGIKFRRNYGKSQALHAGFLKAKGDVVFTMDADLQDDPAEIPNLISKLSDGWDLVSGWKKMRHDPLNKTLPSQVFNFVTRLMTGVKIHDFNCGLKGYKQAVVKSIEVYGGRHRYIPALAGQQKFKITEIVVNHRARQFGETKYGGSRMFHGFFDLITILFLNRYTQQPLHLFGMFGIGFLNVGFIVECFVLYFKYALGEPFSKHMALLMLGIMLIVIGIQFFSIGLLGELMTRSTQGQENRIRRFISRD
jgi:glycosyltransferase involved in cell wall biosynthesis